MENKEEEIHGMDIRVDAIQMPSNVPEYMSIQQIQQATAQDEHLQQQKRSTSSQDGQKLKTRYET